MSGPYTRLQARIKELNPNAEYIPCSGHSLNLVGTNAVENCLTLYDSYENIKNALMYIVKNKNEKQACIGEAKSILALLSSPDTCIMICTWNSILTRFNEINKKVQSVNIDLAMVGKKRIKKRKKMFDESNTETDEDADWNYKTKIYLVIIDLLKTQLNVRCEAYSSILEVYGCIPTLYKDHSKHDIKQTCYNLAHKFPRHIQSSKLLEYECFQFRKLILTEKELLEISTVSPACIMLKYIKGEALYYGIFPNVEIILRMYLSTAVSNCTGERSFSVLKRVKNYMRSSMKDDRLNALYQLSIESDLLKILSLDEIINDFATSKSRKKMFL
ncbi:unnamed protein product [Macrosiphum euphorbiae]|uniref:HAT C-terminal dimerisation domain-containing protein n=1 Tax=Macrosiphum euphorbiae TaxID=13131 RepID=A0AAV0W6T3_9HEMI|nr:unnamed protein product [Macrosiphum euphorbiae]